MRNHSELLVEQVEVSATFEPAQVDISVVSSSQCYIYGYHISGYTCGIGLGLLLLFLLVTIVFGLVLLVYTFYRRCIKSPSMLSELRRRLRQYMNIPVADLPACIMLHLYNIIGAEKFENLQNLCTLHQVPVFETNEFHYTEHLGNKSYTVESLITDLISLQCGDVVLMLAKHVDVCITCKEQLLRCTESLSTDIPWNEPENATRVTINTSYVHRNSSENLLCPASPGNPPKHSESPVTIIATDFWSKFGNESVLGEKRHCIRTIVHQVFQMENCTLLKNFYGMKKWPPTKLQFDAILQYPSPAEVYFTSYLAHRPNYTYSKLKRDMERLCHYQLLNEIALHYNRKDCPQCDSLSLSDEFDNAPACRTISSARNISRTNKAFVSDSMGDSGRSTLPRKIMHESKFSVRDAQSLTVSLGPGVEAPPECYSSGTSLLFPQEREL